MALTLDGTNGIVSSGSITTQSATGVIFSDSSSLPAASSPYVLKNRIINGAMVIDQRNAGASVATTTAGSGTYTLDRWQYFVSQTSKFTVQQDAGAVTPPVGFNDYLGCTSSSAYSVLSTELFLIRQAIEGFNASDLAWGTANAKTITLSFWVYSSLTGTFGGAIYNYLGTRSYPFSYTISSANTWTQISITIAGDTSASWTSGGSSSNTNSGWGYISFNLGCGSAVSGTTGVWNSGTAFGPTGAVSVVGTSGATFYITGVQLEIGTTATPFERRIYGTELQLCQRYFYKTFSPATAVANATSYTTGIGVPNGTAYATGAIRYNVMFPQPLRTTPTMTYYSVGGLGTVGSGLYQFFGGGVWTAATATGTGEVSDMYVGVEIAKTSSMTTGYSYLLGGQFTASAEL
jgi:hypothetical protein